MIFTELPIEGAYHVEIDPIRDDRGFFARAWCRDEFAEHGLDDAFVQANTAVTRTAGTIRGLHYQAPPHEEAKFIRCVGGAIYDVMIDLRPTSTTYLEWYAHEISADRRNALYVPAGCAHGYQALEEDTETFYHVTAPYTPGIERGIRYDDPFFQIEWRLPVTSLSEKDQSWPPFDPEAHAAESTPVTSSSG